VIGLRRVLATIFLVLGLSGGFAALAPSASAAPLCLLRLNITIFGTHIGTGPKPICIGS
jgi:hypothetical protein